MNEFAFWQFGGFDNDLASLFSLGSDHTVTETPVAYHSASANSKPWKTLKNKTRFICFSSNQCLNGLIALHVVIPCVCVVMQIPCCFNGIF